MFGFYDYYNLKRLASENTNWSVSKWTGIIAGISWLLGNLFLFTDWYPSFVALALGSVIFGLSMYPFYFLMDYFQDTIFIYLLVLLVGLFLLPFLSVILPSMLLNISILGY